MIIKKNFIQNFHVIPLPSHKTIEIMEGKTKVFKEVERNVAYLFDILCNILQGLAPIFIL